MLVIKGAVYYSEGFDQILIPDRTTTDEVVECFVFENLEDYIQEEGVRSLLYITVKSIIQLAGIHIL